MSRLIALSLTLLSLSAISRASAQETPRLSDAWSREAQPAPAVDRSGWPSTFQFSLSAGFGTSFSSIHEEIVAIEGDAYEDTPDAFGVTGALTLGAVAFHRQYETGHQITLIPGYRASVDSYVFGILDTGFIHRHEATLGLAINRRMVVGLGGGLALAHQDGETFAGGAMHLDLRMGVGGGVFFGLPLNVSVLSVNGANIVLSTLAIEVGWQSLR